jgi:hypothetical protein
VRRPPTSAESSYRLFTNRGGMIGESDVISLVMTKNPNPRIDSVERALADLVQERQTLRASGAEAAELERNRREIVAHQQELSEALISVYAPQPAFAPA